MGKNIYYLIGEREKSIIGADPLENGKPSSYHMTFCAYLRIRTDGQCVARWGAGR